jgi:tRNA pseudouridine32 synthase/23S rRNA pseudouridine746 synthase
VSASPKVLFEDNAFLVVEKPAGWLSIPAREPKSEDQVMSHVLRAHGEIRVVHRLDRFTSGVMLFAKSEIAQKEATKWFEKREVKKVYRFLAAPLPSRPAVQVKTPVDGKSAQTLFEVLEKTAHAFLGQATPLTGRFHQIRAHAEEAGFPILGDEKHGGEYTYIFGNHTVQVPRVCLHAYQLTLPIGEFKMDLPEDMMRVWKEIKSV